MTNAEQSIDVSTHFTSTLIFSLRLIHELLSTPYDCREICYGRLHLFNEIANFMRCSDKVPIIIIITHKFDWNSVTFSASLISELQSTWKIPRSPESWFDDSTVPIDLFLVLLRRCLMAEFAYETAKRKCENFIAVN